MLAVFTLSGCVAPELSSEGVESSKEPLQRFSFESMTHQGSNSTSEVLDLRQVVNEEDALILWVGASCRGCHDWTDMIYEGIENGTIEGLSVVSIHRYAAFEEEEEILSTYVEDGAEHPSSWPVMVPSEDVEILDLDSGLTSTRGIYEAFEQPSTPTLQIYRSDGSIESLEHSYWADWDELVDIVERF
ncbi:MAG: hypothetical protein ACPGN8_05170 [Candidatus Thalassarchaeaceae archaeon]